MAADPTKPNISRIYDYMLGGNHNFEIDRLAAQEILKVFPAYPQWARLNRWFLQMIGDEWSRSDYTCFLDLGSGIPAQGNLHELVDNARVIYVDNDPVVVAYAQEILADKPNVRYILADVRDTAKLLAVADEFFGGERRVAIGFIGLAYFLNDTDLATTMQALHNWAAPGSIMALSYTYIDPNIEANIQMQARFKSSGAELFSRDETATRQIVAPWQVRACKTLAQWVQAEELTRDINNMGTSGEMYGMILDHSSE